MEAIGESLDEIKGRGILGGGPVAVKVVDRALIVFRLRESELS